MAQTEAQLDSQIIHYRGLAYAASTKQAYSSHKKSYFQFCVQMGYNPIPVSQVVLCRYAAHLANRLAFTSVKKYLNIIRILHLEAGFPNPLRENWFLDTVLRGIARDKGKAVRRKLPITPTILLQLKSQLDLSTPRHTAFWAAALIGFFGFLRKSNLLSPSVSGFNPSKHLTRQDFVFFDWGVMLQIKWAKTIQFGERVLESPLPRLRGHPLCPVEALLRTFLISRGVPPNAPAFCFLEGHTLHHLTPAKFIHLLKSKLAFLGYNPQDYSGHSFRRGAATWALQNGLPGETIKILGDWRSTAYLAYLSLDYNAKFQSITKFSKSLPSTV